MGKELSEFNFEGWLAETWPRRSFRDCVRRAADQLLLGGGRLPTRVSIALLSFFFCDEQDVPQDMKADFAEILREIRRRARTTGDNIELKHVDIVRLDRSLRRCSPATAQRIARKIAEWDRTLTVRGAHDQTAENRTC